MVDIFKSAITSCSHDNQRTINEQILKLCANNTEVLHKLHANVGDVLKKTDQIIHEIVVKMLQLHNDLNRDIDNIITSKVGEKIERNTNALNAIVSNETNKTVERIEHVIQRTENNVKTVINAIIPQMNTAFVNDAFKDIQSVVVNAVSTNNQHANAQTMAVITQKFDAITDTFSRFIHAQNAENTRNHHVIASMDEYLNKYRNSSIKGQLSETRLLTLLNKMFPNDEIIDTSSTKESCDFLISRVGKPTILVENKNYSVNVNTDEVNKFIRDTNIQNANGIFLSQNSGIVGKRNFEINIVSNNILIYAHNVNYSQDVIQTMVDIVDHLHEAVARNLANNPNASAGLNKTFVIDETLAQAINDEYTNFINMRLNAINSVREFEKRLTTQLSEFKMPSIEHIVSRFFSNTKQATYKCDVCNSAEYTNLASLAAHKRHCIKNAAKEAAKKAAPTIVIN